MAIYAANKIENADITVVDLNNFDLPLYSIDLEIENGIPSEVSRLSALIENTDGLVVSLAEHNGSYSAAFKNAFDWLSRLDSKVWKNKPMLLMATSPGGRGGATVLETAKATFPRLGANVVAHFSLPSFGDNYSESGLNNEDLNLELNTKIKTLAAAL